MTAMVAFEAEEELPTLQGPDPDKCEIDEMAATFLVHNGIAPDETQFMDQAMAFYTCVASLARQQDHLSKHSNQSGLQNRPRCAWNRAYGDSSYS
jgi:hypothetical protein